MERGTASRRAALAICTGLGVVACLTTIALAARDRATVDTVRAHVVALYTPYGTVPDPGVPWLALDVVLGAGAACWALGLAWLARDLRGARAFCAVTSLAGTVLLGALALVQEHGTAILPDRWRLACLGVALLAATAAAVALLPVTGRIRR